MMLYRGEVVPPWGMMASENIAMGDQYKSSIRTQCNLVKLFGAGNTYLWKLTTYEVLWLLLHLNTTGSDGKDEQDVVRLAAYHRIASNIGLALCFAGAFMFIAIPQGQMRTVFFSVVQMVKFWCEGWRRGAFDVTMSYISQRWEWGRLKRVPGRPQRRTPIGVKQF